MHVNERPLTAPEVLSVDWISPEDGALDRVDEVREGGPEGRFERGPFQDLPAREARFERESREPSEIVQGSPQKGVYCAFIITLDREGSRVFERGGHKGLVDISPGLGGRPKSLAIDSLPNRRDTESEQRKHGDRSEHPQKESGDRRGIGLQHELGLESPSIDAP
jgi:hypothetical protein